MSNKNQHIFCYVAKCCYLCITKVNERFTKAKIIKTFLKNKDMASLNKANLVKDGKYNKAEIMKRAWMYVKNPFTTMYHNNFKWALQRAWLDAKEVMAELNTPEPEYYFKPNRSVEMLRACSGSDNMRRGHVCW